MATPSSGTSGGSSGTTVPPSMSYDPTTGVTFLQSSDVNALAKPGDTYTVSFGRRMDPYGKTNELYGVYSSKAAADKAVAQVKAWADQIKKDDARRGIVKSDWDITTIEVQRSGTKSASNPGKGSFGYDPNGIKTSASGKPAASFGGLMGAISSTRLQWPLKGAIRITTTYGSVDGRHKTPHKGIDIAAPAGSPVYAASGGKVIVSGPVAGFGNAIYVQQPNGVVVIYGHLGSKALMPVGATVSAGELIGKIGTKQEGGHTTGPHLHLQVQPDITKGSTTIDPMQLIAPDQLARPTTSSISKRP
jgi:murein DD-endopeptidase MepM/ murein hydrolase activator NlpD